MGILLRKQRSSKRTRLAILLTLVLTLLATGATAGVRQVLATQETAYHTVVVQAGDTLWDIARRWGDARTDIRNLVWKIRVMNQLESTNIYPGQVLVVPSR